MPNTLAHFGVQGVVTRSVIRRADAKWIFLGCVLPDVPWILQRLLQGLWPSLDPLVYRPYFIAQASLIACLFLVGAVASLSARPRWILAILGSNAVLHLLLDAAQTKWGNGVHLFAPFSWEMLNIGLFWPESLMNYALTLFGIGVFFWFGLYLAGEPVGLRLSSPRRLFLALLLVSIWMLGPHLVRDGPRAADNHSVQTFSAPASRTGRTIELDRVAYFVDGEREYVRVYAGEEVSVVGETVGRPGIVSLRGRFVDRTTIAIDEFHEHRGRWRDWASIVGLLLLLGLWAPHVLRSVRSASPGN